MTPGQLARLPLEPNLMKRLRTTLSRSLCPDQSAGNILVSSRSLILNPLWGGES
jgi:hypothetical protein